jgi:hypothetical protein
LGEQVEVPVDDADGPGDAEPHATPGRPDAAQG